MAVTTALVDELLNAACPDLEVATESVPSAGRSGNEIVLRACLLEDKNGALVAISPSNQLLDLAALGRFTGRELRATTPEAVDSVCKPLGLDKVPAVPGLIDLPIVVDEGIFHDSSVLLESGTGNSLLKLPLRAFEALLDTRSAFRSRFCVAIDEISLCDDPYEDRNEISAAVSKFTSRRIRSRLEDTLEFPPLPEIAQRIIQLAANPLAGINELAEIVRLDPPLSAQIVSWAASPYYAAPGPIRSIHDAIVRVLGFDLVMNLALGLALGKTLNVPRDGQNGYRAYWQQAVYCAAVTEALVKAMPAEKRPEIGRAYLAGLLHNFGFLLMAELFKPQLELVSRYCDANTHIGYRVVESFLLGVTRDQLAAFLAGYWQLPEEICLALRLQDTPDVDGPHGLLIATLNIAKNELARHHIGQAPTLSAAPELYAQLGLSTEQVQNLSNQVFARNDELSALVNTLAA